MFTETNDYGLGIDRDLLLDRTTKGAFEGRCWHNDIFANMVEAAVLYESL